MHPLHRQVRDYYEGKLRAHGATPSGVDWNSQASQELRFAQLAQLWQGGPEGSVLDFGCGYGALLAWLRATGFTAPYAGFDLSEEMIGAAEAAAVAAGLTGWDFTAARNAVAPADYVVASGLFNVRMNITEREWREYVLGTIDELASLATRGFAFNALTLYSDADRRRPDLYYADPLELFDHCKRRHSRAVALMHDYPLYEFTMIVRRS
jgi:SAM-dependent methyltransferase